MINQGLLPEEV